MLGSRKVVESLSTTTGRCASALLRQFSSTNQIRAFPQYAVFGENSMLAIKMIPPAFKYVGRTQTIGLDGSKKGRLLLEWVPRNPLDGRFKIPDLLYRQIRGMPCFCLFCVVLQ